MGDAREGMLAFLGVAPDSRLLHEDLVNLPDAEQRREPTLSTHQHDRLVAAGSVLTGSTLLGGAALGLYGGWQALLNGGGVLDVVVALIGILLVATHWGWVHVAEYVGLTIDGRQQRAIEAQSDNWLVTIEPYPRFSVSTDVLDDATTRVTRYIHRPVLTPRHTFTFVREMENERLYDADTPAADIATGVETMRRQARLDTDRLARNWEAASSAYDAALLGADDDQEHLAAQRAAATALSEHINASLRQPPLVE
jgi:hypothetical protein